MNRKDEYSLQRRVAGYHDIRMDGLTDLVTRAPRMKILDLGCNRGLVAFEFANNGAREVHGCDIFEEGIRTAKELFIDLRAVKSRFEVVDLTQELPFPDEFYDIVLMIATYHKLKRVMGAGALTALVKDLGRRCDRFFCWRGNGNNVEAMEEMVALDRDLGTKWKRVHTTSLSITLGLAAIWAKDD